MYLKKSPLSTYIKTSQNNNNKIKKSNYEKCKFSLVFNENNVNCVDCIENPENKKKVFKLICIRLKLKNL